MKIIPTETYSRVVGYFRKISNWNKGKKQEWSEREPFEVLNDSRINKL